MRFRQLVVISALALVIAGCETEADVEGTAVGTGTPAKEQKVGDRVAALEEKIFPEGIGSDKCAVLTLEDVTAATGVPASAILQRPISGCMYSWDAGDSWPLGTVFLTMVRAHDSLERARTSFAQSTRDVAAEEVGGAKEQVQDELADKAREGEISEGQARIGSSIVDAMPERDFKHQKLRGVGNEAVLEGRSVQIRYGNLTIHLGAQMNDEDQLDPALATELGRRIVQNLDAMREAM